MYMVKSRDKKERLEFVKISEYLNTYIPDIYIDNDIQRNFKWEQNKQI
jgi:hypothetical protein